MVNYLKEGLLSVFCVISPEALSTPSPTFDENSRTVGKSLLAMSVITHIIT